MDRAIALLTVMSLSQARRHKRRFDAVLTVEDPTARRAHQLRFHRDPHPAHLILAFDDIDRPHPNWRHATEDDVRAGLDFARQHAAKRLLVHCFAGVGRSPSMALAILADRLKDPHQALARMLELQPDAVPNHMVLGHADRLLGFDGHLVSVVTDWERERLAAVRLRLRKETLTNRA